MANKKTKKGPEEILTGFVESAETVIVQYTSTLELTMPDRIYHYTGKEKIEAILKSGTIWLSDIFHLNDPSELKHGTDIAINLWKKKINPAITEHQLFTRNLSFIFHQDFIQKTSDYFSCSFSTEDDSLGQWIIYADDARGYALGFDSKILEGSFKKEINSSSFPIEYDGEKIISIYNQLMDIALPLISACRKNHLSGHDLKNYLKKLSHRLAASILNVAIHFKHPAYQYEKEYRFIQLYGENTPRDEVKERSCNNQVINYTEFKWKELGALKIIKVGPAANQPKAKRFAEDLLAEFGITGVTVDCSDIPYRSFRG